MSEATDFYLARAIDRIERVLVQYDGGPRASGVAMFDVEDVRRLLRAYQGAPEPQSAEQRLPAPEEDEADRPWWRKGSMG